MSGERKKKLNSLKEGGYLPRHRTSTTCCISYVNIKNQNSTACYGVFLNVAAAQGWQPCFPGGVERGDKKRQQWRLPPLLFPPSGYCKFQKNYKKVGRLMDDPSESRAGFIHSSYWESEPFAIKNNPDISQSWQSRACQLLPHKWRLMIQSQWGRGHWRISTTIVSSHAFWIDCVKVFYFC